jgi:hypothetical protein
MTTRPNWTGGRGTSAPVPQTKTSRAVQTSNRLNGRSSYGIPSSLAISSTVSLVMPSRFVAVRGVGYKLDPDVAA